MAAREIQLSNGSVAIVVAAPRGCGGIGRRARFRSVWGKPRGGSSPLIRIHETSCTADLPETRPAHEDRAARPRVGRDRSRCLAGAGPHGRTANTHEPWV